VSFASPWVLVGLLALPVLAVWYAREGRRRALAARSFVTQPLTPSVAPRRPRWRRHAPYVVLAAALAALIVAAARPQRAVAVPVERGTVMLANDVSDSMTSTDVQPSRLGAAKRAALGFLHGVPRSVEVGSLEFARRTTLLQSPTTDHALAANAVAQLQPGGGGTAIGDALQTSLTAIRKVPKIAGKHPPGAIVLISDGASNIGVAPVQVAEQARREHVKIYTIAIGTSGGTMVMNVHGRRVNTPVPVDPTELRQIAASSGGRAYSASDSQRAQEIYDHLAARLGHTHAQRPLVAGITGVGLVLLLLACALSLRWFARIA
jgi:Ca-activated chloride channel family protein